jgi:Tfp pilus assembly pilus retraction ATPase PilT
LTGCRPSFIPPLEVRDESFLRWLLPQSLLIYADHLEWVKRSGRERLLLAELESVEVAGRVIRIVGRSGQRWVLSCRKALETGALIGRLKHEVEEWESFRKSIPSGGGFPGMLREVLQWIGQPFVIGVDLLFRFMLQEGVSDCHLEPGSDETRITVRKNREVLLLGSFPRSSHAGITARLKALAGCHPHLSGIPQEGACPFSATGMTEIRLSFFPSLYGDRCALRMITPARFPDLGSLGWPGDVPDRWRHVLQTQCGLLLIVGPVGSGKTTALYASLLELARTTAVAPRRIVTIEDPVEARLPGICQASVDGKENLSLAQAFKHLLRQDPDVIALGEIRDRETLQEALQAGLTGHVVLATFHAEHAAAARDRIRQMGVEPYLYDSSLKALLSLGLDRIPCREHDPVACRNCDGSGFILRAGARLSVAQETGAWED